MDDKAISAAKEVLRRAFNHSEDYYDLTTKLMIEAYEAAKWRDPKDLEGDGNSAILWLKSDIFEDTISEGIHSLEDGWLWQDGQPIRASVFKAQPLPTIPQAKE